MDDVYNNFNDYNRNRKRKIWRRIFDDTIADIMTNKKFQAIIKELFIRCRKLNRSLVFIMQAYFSVPKEVRLNSTHYLIMTIHDKREKQQIAINHSAEKVLWRLTEKVQVNHILFWLLILHYQLITT